MSTLNSEIILCKGIRLDKEYVNVLSYTENQMLTLCRSSAHKVASANDYSFIRTTGNIFTNFTYSQCLQANYIAFQNKDYSNKWFFAFIDEVIWKGEANTEIRYTVDSWATWFDEWNVKKCYIERQHVLNDTIGSNIVEENLAINGVICESVDNYNDFSNYYIAVASTFEPSTSQWYNTTTTSWVDVGDRNYYGLSLYNGQIFGDTIFMFDPSRLSILEASMFIEQIIKEGHSADISAMFIIPKNVFGNNDLINHRGYYQVAENNQVTYYYYTPKEKENINTSNKIINKTNNFSNFSPKNNKCYVYPYNYLYVTNHVGNEIIYKYEDFSTSNMNFELEFSISIGCSGRFVPENYKGITSNYNESIPVAKFPTCSWSGDAFTNWLTQNAINIPTQLANIGINTLSTGVSMMAGNMTGGVMGTISISNSIANLIGQFYSANLLPAIKQGSNNADINYLATKNKISFYHMRAKNSDMQIIDDYFTRYGYAIKKLDTPHLTGRRNWNYIEIGSSESIGYGDVPSKFMEEINGACRRGVTIWHTHDNIGDFSLDNSIT